MNNTNKVIVLGDSETKVRQKQHDNNPGKVIVDIFCRGIDIPEEELSEDLRETVQHVRAKLEAQEAVQSHINNNYS